MARAERNAGMKSSRRRHKGTPRGKEGKGRGEEGRLKGWGGRKGDEREGRGMKKG